MIDTTFAMLVAGSFAAAFFNTAFSAGGALIILAVTSLVLPINAIVPVHSTFLIASSFARVYFFRAAIDWRVVRPFLAGAALGALIGARVYVELPEAILATVIALLMLAALWLPDIRWRPTVRHPWAIVGFLHTLVSTLFAHGVVLHSVMLRTNLNKHEIIGTMAGCLTGMGAFKIAGYALFGFDYSPYFAVILAGVAASYVGTLIGRRVVDRVSEAAFRLAYRLLVTVTALRLLYVGLS